MPFNGSGVFSLTTPGQPVVTETVVSSTMFNAVLTEFEVGLSNCITKDGQTTTTASIPFAAGIAVTGATTLNGTVVLNSGGGDNDVRIESDGNTNHFVSDAGMFSGKGAFGFGATFANAFLAVNPPALSSVVDQVFYRALIHNANAVTVPTGTAAVVSSLFVNEPNITATGTVTLAATLYVSGAPTEGGSNYALYVSSGATNLGGSFQCDSIVNDTGLASDTYTPDLFNVTNIDASAAEPCQWMRVGNTVTVSGSVSVDPTSGGSAVELGISLPVASDFANFADCAGAGSTTGSVACAIYADTTNNRAKLEATPASAGSLYYAFTFTYRVL